jgi:hypothetical protein
MLLLDAFPELSFSHDIVLDFLAKQPTPHDPRLHKGPTALGFRIMMLVLGSCCYLLNALKLHIYIIG